MPMHINITVGDVDRSTEFYRRWLGFDGETRRFDDGTVFVRDEEGTDLAFHQGVVVAGPAPFHFHFGFRRPDPEHVRRLQRELSNAGVEIVAHDDDVEITSVKFRDPDGYVVEVYYEP